jgi:sugar phosphate isomerase/epimerase
MKIGISSASLYPLETEKALDFLGENGVEVTEIFFNSPSELNREFIAELRKIREYHGIEVCSVHPCGSVGEPYFLFSGYPRRYNDSFEYYKKYYYAAAELGAKAVVLHGDSLKGHIPMEEYCERLIMMNQAAAEFGVAVCHENVNRYRGATPENILEMRKLTDDKLKFTLDVKQSVRDGCGVDAMYEAMRGNVINVHISDHNKYVDCMLPGNGGFDFKSLFDRLKSDGYDGVCLIEVYSYAYNDYGEILESLNKMKKLI